MAWTFGSEFVIACGPIVWIITAVIAVVALLYEAWTHNFGGIQEATSEWIGQVSAGLQQFWDGLVSWASGIANVLVGVGTAIWDLIHGDLQGAKNAAAKMVEGLGQIIQGFGQVTVGAVRTMLNAVLNIAQRKFGTFGDMMRNTVAVKFSSLVDSWKQTLDKFGQAWFPMIQSITDSLTPFIDYLSQSGEIGRIGTGIANALGGLFGSNSGNGMQRGIALVMATLERLPDVISGVGNAVHHSTVAFGQGIVNVYNAIGSGVVNATNWIKDSIVSTVNVFRKIEGEIIGFIQNSGIFKFINGLLAVGEAVKNVLGTIANNINSALQAIGGVVKNFLDFVVPMMFGIGDRFKRAFDIAFARFTGEFD